VLSTFVVVVCFNVICQFLLVHEEIKKRKHWKIAFSTQFTGVYFIFWKFL